MKNKPFVFGLFIAIGIAVSAGPLLAQVSVPDQPAPPVQFMNDSVGTIVLAPADSAVMAADRALIDHNTITRIGNIAIPGWVQSVIACLLVMATSIQFLLKRIPTPYSVKICGVLGKILDFFTAFQKDKNDVGGVHPPACIKKP